MLTSSSNLPSCRHPLFFFFDRLANYCHQECERYYKPHDSKQTNQTILLVCTAHLQLTPHPLAALCSYFIPRDERASSHAPRSLCTWLLMKQGASESWLYMALLPLQCSHWEPNSSLQRWPKPSRPKKLRKREGPTEIWTQIAGFRVQSANHYTMEPA